MMVFECHDDNYIIMISHLFYFAQVIFVNVEACARTSHALMEQTNMHNNNIINHNIKNNNSDDDDDDDEATAMKL